MMISKRTSTEFVEEMLGVDMEKMAHKLVTECKKQWEERKRRHEITSKAKIEKQNNLLRAIPNTWCKLVKSQITPCPKCKKPEIICSSWHMKNIHTVEIKDIHDIWRDICETTKLDQKRITRNEITQVSNIKNT